MNPVTYYCQAILGDDAESRSSIRLIPELKDCSEALLEKIFCYSKPIDLNAGEILIKEGEYDQWVYFIVKGDLEVLVKGQEIGKTTGPVVGERCILGEPRGASLIAGEKGIVGLGIEMTIIDELQKEVYAIDTKQFTREEYYQKVENSYKISVELLGIILNEVIGRIIELSSAGETMYEYFTQVKLIALKQVDSFHDFSDQKYQQQIDERSLIDEKYGNNINFCSFSAFATIVGEEFQKNYSQDVSDERFKVDWKDRFIEPIDGCFDIIVIYLQLIDKYQLTYQDLLDFTYVVFEIASKYTAAANKAINEVLSLFGNESEKKSAWEKLPSSSVCEKTQIKIAENLKKKLFDPINQLLESPQEKSVNNENSKLSQADIDQLFG